MKKFNKDKYLRKLKIKRFFRNNSRYFYIVLSCLLCGFLGIYFTYSKFFISDEQAVIKTTVGDFTRGDIVLNIYVDGKKVSNAPKKNAGYIFKNANCDNDATFIWTNSNWKFLVSNITKKTKCSLYFQSGKIYEYAYTGIEEEFVAQKAGIYKIETWGAQGGSNEKYVGGSGGYATGEIKLNIGEKLYINVGGQGASELTDTNIGGYNGGGYSGNGSYANSFGGGGATHIAKTSGLLSTLEKKKDDILIVAGGGGGAITGSSTIGGSGGGYIGVNGSASDSQWNTSTYIPGGGMQTGAGTAYGGSARQGKFGSGQTGNTSGWGGGGGGGLYGGSNGHGTTGAGGSGYIGNSLLNNKIMYCYNCTESSNESTKTISTTCNEETPTEKCAKKGNGYVILTLINEFDQSVFNYTGKEQIFTASTSGYYKLEVWGAEGGGPEGNEGGLGSYSKGLIYLNSGTTAYINVGGTGKVSDNTINSIGLGGYNGGGNGMNSNSGCTKFLTGGGGGATHIALKSGTLNTLENNKDDILIVAGGGGGGNYCNSYNHGHGGSAGGLVGNPAYNLGEHYQANGYGQGGTQSSFGCSSKVDYCGTFGNGSSSDELGVGAGGGYFGGGGSEINGAGGGSGYIGNTLLTDKAMYCYNCIESSKIIDKTINTTCSEENPVENCVKNGDGYARITYLPININFYIEDQKIENIPNKNDYILDKISCEKSSNITWNNDNWNLIVNNYDENDTCKILFKSSDVAKIVNQLDSNGKCPTVNEDGTVTVTKAEETDGYMCKAKDIYGDSYYYRGNVTNNYVKFANLYWRIVRMNGDESIRVIYDGTSAHANGESSEDRQVGTSAFNSSSKDNAYVGYMYGTPSSKTYEETHVNTNNSTIKNYLEDWYKTNIVANNYDDYIVDNIFCNDRSFASSNTADGTGTTLTYYASYDSNKLRTFICSNKNDTFTANNNANGNGLLTYPIGLITADEAILAGGYNTDNSNFYLYTGQVYWTMTPYLYDRNYYNVACNRYINSNGTVLYALMNDHVDYQNGVRPVINLTKNILRNGDGTVNNPYRLSEE